MKEKKTPLNTTKTKANVASSSFRRQIDTSPPPSLSFNANVRFFFLATSSRRPYFLFFFAFCREKVVLFAKLFPSTLFLPFPVVFVLRSSVCHSLLYFQISDHCKTFAETRALHCRNFASAFRFPDLGKKCNKRSRG